MSLPGVTILGVGHHLPEHVEDNATLCRNLSVTPEWILEKTGIEGRCIAAPEEHASDYATRAVTRALEMAGLAADEVDLIIACTFSGDYLFPPLSAKVQRDIRAPQAQIYDLQANCSGFVAGLTAASDRMKVDPTVRHAVVVGVEFCSRYIDRTDVNTAIYLADGAGAAVLGRCEPGHGILASAFFTDSSNYEAVRLRGGGSSFPMNGRPFDPTVDLMEMNGLATWKQAITHLPPTIRRACAKAGLEPAALDFLVFHQANLRLIEYVMKKMGFPPSRTYTNVARIGNSGAASLPVALSEAVALGALKPGDHVALAAVGAGFNFAASVWRWTLPGGAR
ncbi:MAG TPA: ketoacyl-ACP synthase III [Holophagaceae bacterium]|nr:ketoacyl-ACP synthase III [Holophagaceae bacterium]